MFSSTLFINKNMDMSFRMLHDRYAIFALKKEVNIDYTRQDSAGNLL